MMRKFFLIFVCLTLLSGCNLLVKEKEPEEIKVFYKNGNVFCEGTHRVYEKFFKEHKSRQGTWECFHPNGLIANYAEYDNEGNLLKSKKYSYDGVLVKTAEFDKEGEIVQDKAYSESGILTSSMIVDGDTWVETIYHDSGELKSEIITDWVEEEGDWYYSEMIKDYYKNGELKFQMETDNGDIDGVFKAWDEEGNLILEIEYNDGLIELEEV